MWGLPIAVETTLLAMASLAAGALAIVAVFLIRASLLHWGSGTFPNFKRTKLSIF